MKITIPIESLRRFRKQSIKEAQTRDALHSDLIRWIEKGKTSISIPQNVAFNLTENHNFIFN